MNTRWVYVIPWLSLSAFLAGILVWYLSADLSIGVAEAVYSGIGLLSVVGPVIVFFCLAPILSQVLVRRSETFPLSFVIRFVIQKRLLSMLAAIVFCFLVFPMPIVSQGSVGFASAAKEALKVLGHAAISNSYMLAIYAAILVAFVGTRVRRVDRIMARIPNLLEKYGIHLQLLVPPILFGLGCFVSNIPTLFLRELGQTTFQIQMSTRFGEVVARYASPSVGVLWIYVTTSVLVGACCLSTHALHLLWIKVRIRGFRVRTYLRRYWLNSYPLLWGSCSEALAAPLNMALGRKVYGHVRSDIRTFLLGIGSYLGVSGTIMCVFVLAVSVAQLVGVQVSLLQLVMLIPLVLILSFAVAGIPGELLLFAGPVSTMLGMSPTVQAIFVTLYIGFQFGLPDSFRTGHNSTENMLYAILVDARLKEGETPRVLVKAV